MELNPNRFGRIGVLLGGPSNEREISLKSGSAVYEALKVQGLDVKAIDITSDDWQSNYQLISKAEIDIAFIALHGLFGEDGKIQALLDQLNIPYTGSGPSASNLAMDKVASREIFRRERLPVPDYIVLLKDDKSHILSSEEILRSKKDLRFPLVVKPATCGSSIGLSIVEDGDELKKAVDFAFGFDVRIIIEEYISGREITVGILGDSALPVIEIVPDNRFFDYEAKYTQGKSRYIIPAELSDELTAKVKEVALSAHRSLGCWGFSRVDMRLAGDDTAYVLEVNSIPGLTQMSLLPKAAKAKGIDFISLCRQILELAYEKEKIKISR